MRENSAARRALRRAVDGRSLDVTEAAVLMGLRNDTLDKLLAAASAVRDAGLASAGRPRVVTYSSNVFIPLTRLCRNRCHYCAFAAAPRQVAAPFLDRDEVLAIAEAGAEQGCKEALFTLGDRPECRWPVAREWLQARGFESTVDYLRAMAVAVLEETGLLPHLNPGVLSWTELQRLRPVAASMGMMLETTAERLWSQPGGPHYGSPDKQPAVRLRVLADAGRVGVPFTTGILVGIGETHLERAESLHAIRHIGRQYGHVQEVIIQGFRAQPGTAMRDAPETDLDDLAATVAVARLVLGPQAHIQVAPNLIGSGGEPGLAEVELLLRAGIDDWGGLSPVTPDHVNPEHPWPALPVLAELCSRAGFEVRERLAVYPEYTRATAGGAAWIDPRMAPYVRALADPATGLARPGARPSGRPGPPPDHGGPANEAADQPGGDGRWRGFDPVYGDWADVAARARQAAARPAPTCRLSEGVREALRIAEKDPAGLLAPEHEPAALALFEADGADLDALARLADELRRDRVGDEVTYVVNRNINFTNVCYVGCRFCAFSQRERDADSYRLSVQQVADRAEQAWLDGATEVCLQGGIDPALPPTAYADLVRAIKQRAPGIHIHAFSPMELVTGAAKAGTSIGEYLAQLRDAGLGTIPGTAAEILDDDVRWVLTKGKLPASTWVEVVTTAHRLGIRSSATMMYGHVDTSRHWLGHFRVLAGIQDETGGFTELVALPFVHHNTPIYLAGIARPGPTWRENRAVHAMARILLHGRIDNIQCSWVKLGDAGAVALLQGGCNDLGGTLMEETISRMAGSEHGSARSVAKLRALAEAAGRPARERTTTYERVDRSPTEQRIG